MNMLATIMLAVASVVTQRFDTVYSDDYIVKDIPVTNGVYDIEVSQAVEAGYADEADAAKVDGSIDTRIKALENRPTGTDTNAVEYIVGQYDATNLTSRIDAKATSNALAAVAWSGAYGDLSGRPTIPEVPSGIVTTNANGWATGLKIKADGADAGVWLNNGYFNIGANGMAAIELPMYAGIGVTFSGDVNIGAALTVANQIYANSGISAPAPIIATALATVNRDDWSGYTYDGDSSHNLQAALDAKANASSLAAVATSGSYGDLSNKPDIASISNNAAIAISTANEVSNTVYNTGAYFEVTQEGLDLVKSNELVFSSEYELTNLVASATIELYSGRTAYVVVDGANTNLTINLKFPTNAQKMGDTMLRVSAATNGLIGALQLNGETSFVPMGIKDDGWKFDAGEHLYSFDKTAVTNGVAEVWVSHSKSER